MSLVRYKEIICRRWFKAYLQSTRRLSEGDLPPLLPRKFSQTCAAWGCDRAWGFMIYRIWPGSNVMENWPWRSFEACCARWYAQRFEMMKDTVFVWFCIGFVGFQWHGDQSISQRKSYTTLQCLTYIIILSYVPSIQVLFHYIQVLRLRFDSDARQLHPLFSVDFCNTVMLWILHSTVCKAELRCNVQCNLQSNGCL